MTLKIFAYSGAMLLAGTVCASAALLDFTDGASYDTQGLSSATGTLADGTTWTLTPKPTTFHLTYVAGDAPNGAPSTTPLAGQNDGVGVTAPGQNDDEITNGTPMEYLQLTFSKAVNINTLYFLDLFKDAQGVEKEIAYVESDTGGSYSFAAYEPNPKQGGQFGFGAFAGHLWGKTFTFSVSATNDAIANPDFALAGLEVAAVPVPAGAALMLTALGGLGLARRRKTA